MVSVEPSWTHPGQSLLAVARGPHGKALAPAGLYGPFPAEEVATHVAALVAGLRAEGFAPPPLKALADLDAASARTRARAARQLAWRRDARAVDPLLQQAESPRQDISTILDALGWLGDPRAIPAARREAERKLLSRRRSGTEALRNLGDREGLLAVAQRAWERLPEGVRAVLVGPGQETATATADGPPELVAATAARVLDAISQEPMRQQGLVLDGLYEIGGAAPVAAVRAALPSVDLAAPYLWRYAKSLWKRAMLRFDLRTFGLLAQRIERVGLTATATRADLKSGLDGETRSTLIFGRRTRAYVLRRSWRYLRRLASWRPELYSAAAAEVLVRYVGADLGQPKGDFGAYANCYLLHRILWGRGQRYRFLSGSMRFRKIPGATVKAPAGVREESYPELWDRFPAAYLTVLAGASLPVVQSFAFQALTDRHPDLLSSAGVEQLAALLSSAHDQAVELALAELQRRFDPARPDAALVAALLADPRATLRGRGLAWLVAAAHHWPTDAAACIRLLLAAHEESAPAVIEALAKAFASASGAQRTAAAVHLLAILGAGEPAPGAHGSLAALGRRALATEVALLRDAKTLLRMVEEGSPAAQEVGAAALALAGDPLSDVGLPKIIAMARHAHGPIRAAGLVLLERALPDLGDDPAALLSVAECDYPDARQGAVALLRRLDLKHLPLDALFEIVDSSCEELQAFGSELLEQAAPRLPAEVVVPRLLEHPAPGMRALALALAERQLSGSAATNLLDAPAARAFLRAVLMDLRPSRDLKRQALALLVEAGARREDAAHLAVAILGDMVRNRTRGDFEDAVAALTRLHLAFPAVVSPVKLVEGPR